MTLRTTLKPKSPRGPSKIRLTNPGRVLYTDLGITKKDLADYYAQVAEWILPGMADRPLSLVRCPSGMSGKCFYQKRPPAGLPDAVDRIRIREKEGPAEYVVVRGIDGVIALVQFGVLEFHGWGARADDVEHPDRLVFDLDPDDDLPWRNVVAAADELRSLLNELQLQSFLSTTGGKGLHLTLPITRRHTWGEAKRFAKAVADTLVAARPKQFVANIAKAARRGKIFIDYLRNDRGATAIVPYSTRAKRGAPVATPLAWNELPKIDSAAEFDVRSILARLRKLRRDPWEEYPHVRQSITASAKRKLKLA